MTRLYALLITLVFATIALAQDTTAPATNAETPSPEAAEAADDDAEEPVEFDDPTLDEQTYEDDEDVFVPTEEIPSDEPIPFPTNI